MPGPSTENEPSVMEIENGDDNGGTWKTATRRGRSRTKRARSNSPSGIASTRGSKTGCSGGGTHPLKAITLQPEDGASKFSELGTKTLHKEIEKCFGPGANVKPLPQGGLVIVPFSVAQAQAIREAKEIAGIPIAQRGVDSSKDVEYRRIIGVPQDLSKEEIAEGLREENVTFSSLRKLGGKNKTYVIGFPRNQVPEKVRFFSQSSHVFDYTPLPLQCYRCRGFGHTVKFCRRSSVATEICGNCGEDHAFDKDNPCSKPPSCKNCKGAHHAKDRSCPVFRREAEVIRVQRDNAVSFPEARELVRTKSYAEAAKKQPRLPQRIRTGDPPPIPTPKELAPLKPKPALSPLLDPDFFVGFIRELVSAVAAVCSAGKCPKELQTDLDVVVNSLVGRFISQLSGSSSVPPVSAPLDPVGASGDATTCSPADGRRKH